jgi:hypothetical protein
LYDHALSIQPRLVRLRVKEDVMQFLLMIYSNERQVGGMSQSDLGKMMAEYGSFTQSLKESGHYLGGNRLEATTAARSVRVREGKRITTDGPFAETKEQLGGYYLVEARDYDEAAALAARIPGARLGTIEVRAVAPTPAGDLQSAK